MSVLRYNEEVRELRRYEYNYLWLRLTFAFYYWKWNENYEKDIEKIKEGICKI